MNGKFENTKYAVPYYPMMSRNEQGLFISALKPAASYFEYGVGGSSIWAAAHGLKVNGVESDPHWITQVKNAIDPLEYDIDYVDLGPTGHYGKPLQDNFLAFEHYSKSILRHNRSFGLVLIDGRFRVACAVTVALAALSFGDIKDTTIYFHDFNNRPEYHVVLNFLQITNYADDAVTLTIRPDANSTLLNEVWDHYKHNYF